MDMTDLTSPINETDRPINLEDIFQDNIRNIQVFSDSENIRFFFFGCWNDNRDATRDIVNNINSLENESKCLFGLVCGDNVYPQKESGNKIADINHIIEGFNILKNFDGLVYIGLGNHEVDTTEKCKALLDEKRNSTNNIVMPNNYYSIDVIHNSNQKLITKIIMLDTNLLEGNTCYGKHNDIIEEEMMRWLNNELMICKNQSITPIVAGHYPLFYFKENKNNKQYTFTVNVIMTRIYEMLYDYQHPIQYICADIHNYQYITTNNITQHIVGTGGAQQDKIVTVDIPFMMENTQNIYNIIKCEQKYGYLYVDVDSSITTGDFREIPREPIVKQKKDKTKKDLQD